MGPVPEKWDVIIIGSGIGGLACAAALEKRGRRSLVVQQDAVPGGLTQTFCRKGFTRDVGVHYAGQMEPGEDPGRLLGWLCDGRITMASLGPVYDTSHFPGLFEIAFSRPMDALMLDLKEQFPESGGSQSIYGMPRSRNRDDGSS